MPLRNRISIARRTRNLPKMSRKDIINTLRVRARRIDTEQAPTGRNLGRSAALREVASWLSTGNWPKP